jgi:hypothetical protein
MLDDTRKPWLYLGLGIGTLGGTVAVGASHGYPVVIGICLMLATAFILLGSNRKNAYVSKGSTNS